MDFLGNNFFLRKSPQKRGTNAETGFLQFNAWDPRVHRVATAFWRTFSDEGKIDPGWWGLGGRRPPPLFTFTITSKVAVYAPAEWEDTLTLFHL